MKMLLLACMVGLAYSAPKNDLTCTICVDIITDLDAWITSDTTESEIVDFLKGVSQISILI